MVVRNSARQTFITRRTQARRARRLAWRSARVGAWWSSLPEPRPEYMTPCMLQVSLGQPLRRMAAALRWLGWQKIIRRVYGNQVPLWLPPTTSIRPRPPGRPPWYIAD